MNRPGNLSAVAVVALFLAVGCGDSSKSAITPPPAVSPTTGAPSATPTPNAPVAVAPQGVIKIPRDKLAIGDYMPPLDDDRMEIAKPEGWQALPRDSAYLTRFYETNRNGLPRIEVTVEARTYGSLTTVTSENVEQFAKLVAEELGDLELIEPVLPLQVGDTTCARYVGRVELKLAAGQAISAERQRLLVLHDGRLYTIDLLVLPNTLLRSRDAGYAACASLRFGGTTEPATGGLLPE